MLAITLLAATVCLARFAPPTLQAGPTSFPLWAYSNGSMFEKMYQACKQVPLLSHSTANSNNTLRQRSIKPASRSHFFPTQTPQLLTLTWTVLSLQAGPTSFPPGYAHEYATEVRMYQACKQVPLLSHLESMT